MCVPLGNRRKSYGYYTDHVSVGKITKACVDEILSDGGFECYCKKDKDSDFIPYEGCLTNLYLILHDGKTKVKIAGSRTPGYRKGYRTVVMKAPSLSATFLIQSKM